MKYQPLRNFLLLLAHPVSILAMVVLFVNDHILRIYWPSWWTGKIGDFAWLFFAPFVVGALIALFFPNRPVLEKYIGITAFGLIGGVFIFAKAVPAVNALLVHQAALLLGIPIRITLDPTDLMALIMLPFGFWFWRRSEKVQMAFPKRAWVVLPFAALLTIANSAAPNYGIDCLTITDQKTLAYSGYYSYITYNGGLTWQEFSYSAPDCSKNAQDNTIQDINHPDILYLFSSGSNIEKSSDGGKTWQIEFDISSGNPVKKAFYEKSLRESTLIPPGPLDAIFDPNTGNIIFAMGNEGVLVRVESGNWVWVAVGDHEHIEFTTIDALFNLSDEICLAIFLAALLLFTWAVVLNRSGRKEFVLGLSWVICLVLFFLLPSVQKRYYGISLVEWFILIYSLIITLLSINILRASIGNMRRTILRLIGQSLLSAILFLLPYFLWAMGILSNYNLAMTFALVFSIANLFMGLHSIKNLSKKTQQPHVNSTED